MNAIILSAILGVVLMFSGIFFPNKATVRNIANIGMLLLLVANLAEQNGHVFFHINTNDLLSFSKFGLLFNSIAIGSTLFYMLLSGRDIEKVGINVAEYFALIFFVLCGVAIVSCYNSLLMLFIGIEIISIPLYILTGSDKRNLKSNEASLKYFLMGTFSTGIMLMGITLIYGAKGSFRLDEIGYVINAGREVWFATGLLLLLISMAFKVSAAPFHFWTPDVYDGAPTVFTSFMATIVKAAAFIGFLRLFETIFPTSTYDWKLILAVIIAATLFIGNVSAVFQQSVKRMLAYSSIAQAGFMLFALFSRNDMSREGIILYTLGYSLATIGIFAVLIKLKDYTFDGFNGLARTQPVLAATATVFLLSLAGIPLTIGFFAKYFMLASAVKSGAHLWLVFFAVLCAVVSVYYYFRVIQSMYFKEGFAETEEVQPVFRWLLVLLAGAIVVLGIFPNLILQYMYF
ncbi:NADH-quinone oxidoreductase subunit N [Flavihumibacter profundi]|uniref:NADH-quinone oxidoreductase subunit N n=1 Tax=Flavihumibacter profundi TaxID=2716883 RepID=UPI001CC60B62|nr:NADH-quinone oxidoreductase subunit N [Flavihumibacter profundi]MBZ5859462.1 NADH-quinone oxidoreductase subunit N [Flavihumibacter profundi]